MPGLPTTDLAATAAGMAFRTGLLVVPDAATMQDPTRWPALLERGCVTVWNSVPALVSRRQVPSGNWLSHWPPSSANTLATPIRSARSVPRPARRSRRTCAASRARPSARAPAYEISPSASQPVAWQTLTLSVAGRAWPRTPSTATRSGPTCRTSTSPMSATTSGVR